MVVGVAADAVYSTVREAAPSTWYLLLAHCDVQGLPFASARLSVRINPESSMILNPESVDLEP